MSAIAAEQFQHQAPPPDQYQNRRASVFGKFVDRFRSGNGPKVVNSRGGLLPDEYYENKIKNSGESARAEEEHVPPPAAARSRKRGSISVSASALSAKMRGGRRETGSSNQTSPVVAAAPKDIWTESYKALRDDRATSELTLTYEDVVSQQLPKQLKQDRQDAPLRECSDQERFDLLMAITRRSVHKGQTDEQAEQSDDEARAMIASCRKAIDGLMSAQPAFAAAWAGLCSLTPELLEPIIERNDMRAGLVHIFGRLSWYGQLENKLMNSNSWNDENEFREKEDMVRSTLSHLFRAVLELEMKCVCATAGVSDPDIDSVVGWDELSGLVRRIMQADDEVFGIVRQNCNHDVQDELCALDGDFRMPSEEEEEDNQAQE
ncbi:hypothetical protein L249_3020 [Ophiocordyceps polyrhachis-furcata BCC 54312]|uniref:NWD NACHT-NTPase N-terminal domain-containing protein n=1 Tax=Ophiocordyceps polyrhachis-furcata BCC 54312 TaxID=1330021 RepID=A0A367LNF8_9HYPO|nr:hypothetical protein L249_3020 [Ophiocordyceps polyrhachis-furcata BCC 54312]